MTTNTTEAVDAEKAVRHAKENEAAFAAGFEAIRSGEEADSHDEPAERAKDPVDPLPTDKAVEPAVEEPATEEVFFAGFTETQLKALLAKAAQVDDLEKQVAKAHGKIGEFNRTLQEYQAREVKAPAASKETADEGPSDSELEADYPDIAKLADIRARRIVEEAMKARPAETGAPAAEIANEIARVQRETEEKFMAFLHKDWREVLANADYKTWLATQDEATQKRAVETPHAEELSEVMTSFKSWKDGGTSRQNTSRDRLEAGLTPRGVAGTRPQVGPTDQDEFRAGFQSVRGT
ncbi:hypothetical protein BH20PSE1_BH20PSE1_01160 [soil metagenome]